MLMIRREQFHAFDRARRESLSRRLMIRLREMDAARGSRWSEAEFEAQTRRGVENGVRFFRNDDDVLRYCDVVLNRLGGWEEAEHPKTAVSMLATGSIAPARRIENFDRWASRRMGAPRAR